MKKPTAASKRFAPFDTIVVPFPYAERLAERKRPALIISAASITRDHGLVWLAMITSADNRRWAGDVVVGDLAAAGLPAPSVIRTAKIATIDASRIIRRIGALSSNDVKAVNAKLRASSPW